MSERGVGFTDVLLASALLSSMAGCGDPLANGNISVLLRLDPLRTTRVTTDGGVKIIVTGANLETGLQVHVDGVPALATTVHSKSKMSFIAPALPVGPKPIVVTLRNQRVSVEGQLVYYARQTGFARDHVILPRFQIFQMLAGDTDGDGRDDLVAFGTDWDDEVNNSGIYHFHNDPDTASNELALREVVTFDTLGGLGWIYALDDINQDGIADLVTHLGLHLGTSSGRFAPAISIDDEPVAEFQPVVFLETDGEPPMEVARFTSSGMQVFRLTSEMSLELVALRDDIRPYRPAPGVTRARATPFHPLPLAADLNADGYRDLAFFKSRQDGGRGVDLHLLYGPSYPTDPHWSAGLRGNLPPQIALDAVDLTGDGVRDLVWTQIGKLGVLDATSGSATSPPPSGEAMLLDGLCRAEFGGFLLPVRPAPEGLREAPLLSMCADDPRLRVWRVQTGEAPVVRYFETIAAAKRMETTVVTSDVNGDGLSDLLIATRDEVIVRYGDDVHDNGSLTFNAHWGTRIAETGEVSTTPGSFGASRRFAAAAGARVSIVEPTADGRLRTTHSSDLGDSRSVANAIAACDVDGNGTDEIFVAGSAYGADEEDWEGSFVETLALGERALVSRQRYEVDAMPGEHESSWLFAGPFASAHTCDLLLVRQWSLAPNDKAMLQTAVAFAFDAEKDRHQRISVEGVDKIDDVDGDGLWTLKTVDIDGDGDLDLYEHVHNGRKLNYTATRRLLVNQGHFVFEPKALHMDFRSPLSGEQLLPRVVVIAESMGSDADTTDFDRSRNLWATAGHDFGWTQTELWVVRASLGPDLVLSNIVYFAVPFEEIGKLYRKPRVHRIDHDGDGLSEMIWLYRNGSFLLAQAAEDGKSMQLTHDAVVPGADGPIIGLHAAHIIDLNRDGLEDLVFATYRRPGVLQLTHNSISARPPPVTARAYSVDAE